LGFEEKRVLSNKVRNNGHFIEGKQFLFDMQNGMNFMRKKSSLLSFYGEF